VEATGDSAAISAPGEPEDQPAVERLAGCIMRPPISLERVQWSGDGEVFYQPKGGHDGRARAPGAGAEAFDPGEFLARVIMHIPEPRRHLPIREAGSKRANSQLTSKTPFNEVFDWSRTKGNSYSYIGFALPTRCGNWHPPNHNITSECPVPFGYP